MQNIENRQECIDWDIKGTGNEFRRVRLSAPISGGWRLQVADKYGQFCNHGACQLLADELGETLEEYPKDLHLKEIEPSTFQVSVADSDRRVVLHAAKGCVTFTGEDGAARMEIDRLDCDANVAAVAGPLTTHERLYGTGERFNSVNQRGKRIEIWAEDRWCQTEGNSYFPIPFVLSTSGYAWLVNRFEGMEIDLGGQESDRWSVSSLRAPLDLYVFIDDDPRALLESLTALSGRAPVPPEWAFGMLVSRHGRTKEFSTAEGVLDMAKSMRALDLPWSAVILEGWPTFDSQRYPQLKKLTETLHAEGKKVMVYEACGRVRANLCSELTGSEQFCIRTRDGNIDLEETRGFNPADAPDRKHSRWVDITGNEAWRWWSETVWGPLLDDIGIDGAKIDFCEQVPEHDDLELSDGRSAKGLHHYYPTKYNTLMHRLFNERRPDGGVCWSRGGGIGAARYPWAWCGDQRRDWGFLKAILRAALSSGLSGVPFMGHDLAGYMPSQEAKPPLEPDVFARGSAFACFNPMMSTHGTVTRPYDFEPAIVDIYRKFSKIHYLLIPYLVEQAKAGCASGLPMMRHLVLHHPHDERARDCEDQFYLGEDLLVAPVFASRESRDVYLPEGDWEGLFDGRIRRGPKNMEAFAAPLDSVPVFVRMPPSSIVLPGIMEEIRKMENTG